MTTTGRAAYEARGAALPSSCCVWCSTKFAGPCYVTFPGGKASSSVKANGNANYANSSSTVSLVRCPKCGEFADEYVEREPPLIFLDLALHRQQAYRHVVCNRPGVDHALGRFTVLCLVVDALHVAWVTDVWDPTAHALLAGVASAAGAGGALAACAAVWGWRALALHDALPPSTARMVLRAVALARFPVVFTFFLATTWDYSPALQPLFEAFAFSALTVSVRAVPACTSVRQAGLVAMVSTFMRTLVFAYLPAFLVQVGVAPPPHLAMSLSEHYAGLEPQWSRT